ncbi:hypothetical protein K469DRAFT_709749, partial [Zopfia rhizophila CBS 207.26]
MAVWKPSGSHLGDPEASQRAETQTICIWECSSVFSRIGEGRQHALILHFDMSETALSEFVMFRTSLPFRRTWRSATLGRLEGKSQGDLLARPHTTVPIGSRQEVAIHAILEIGRKAPEGTTACTPDASIDTPDCTSPIERLTNRQPSQLSLSPFQQHTMAVTDEKAGLGVVEKPNISDIESSGVSSPPNNEIDDIPDPDAGKSPEERAKLVRPSLLPSCLHRNS